MATVKEYIKAQGYSKGDTITNPDNEAETYIVGSRGRAPSFMMKLAGVETVSKSLKASKRTAARAAGKVAKNGFVTLTNGTFWINGEAIYVSEDASIEVPVGAVISGAL